MAAATAELTLDIKTARFVAGFTAFVDRNIVRWRPPAATILNAEFRRAGEAYERTGSEEAAIAVVTELPWRKYIDRVWLSTVPRAGELVSEQLVKAAPPDLFIQAAVRWLRLNGAQHVTWITDTSRDEIGNQIRIGVSKGESRDEIAARITKSRRSITPWRAELIARTEVHAAANYGSLVAAGDVRVPMRKIWVARSGARPTHASASGQRQPLTDAFQVGGYRLEFPGDTSQGAPASEICNCFPANTQVLAGVQAAFRRLYEGDLVEIVTAAGDQLAGTPNHPVLTPRGWLSLDTLEEGDEIFRCGLAERIRLLDPNIEAMPAFIGKIFHSQIFESQRMPRIVMDFDRDIFDGQVNVVLADGKLRYRFNSVLREHKAEDFLPFADSFESLLSGDGDALCMLLGSRFAARLIRCCYKQSAFIGREAGHPQAIGFADGSPLNACFTENSFDYVPGHVKSAGYGLFGFAEPVRSNCVFDKALVAPAAFPGQSHVVGMTATDNAASVDPALNSPERLSEILGDLGVAHPGFVEITYVRKVRRRKFVGHVYNLQTDTGMYLANNIIAHNCRCVMTYEAQRAGRRRAA